MIYGYIRVSTLHQKRTGLGLAAQRRLIIDHARTIRGDKLVKIFSDPAVSGSRVPWLKRPGGAELDRIVQAGDRIVIAKMDRAFRNVLDFSRMLELWQNRGVVVWVLDIGVDTSTPNGRMMATIIASIAQWEAERIGQRIKEAHDERRAQGRKTNGTTAIGWQAVRKRLKPAPDERRIARLALRLRKSGSKWLAVAYELNRRGIQRPPKHLVKGGKKRRYGFAWGQSDAMRWATAAKYGFPITGYHGVQQNRKRSRQRSAS